MTKLMTRAELVRHIRDVTGVPLVMSRLKKDAITGRGPKPKALYGKRPLYEAAEAVRYARSLLNTPHAA